MKKINILLVLVFVAVTFSKCHVMKRTYRNGYYIAWNKKTSHLKNETTLKKENGELNDIVNYREPIISDLLVASTEKAITPIEKKKLVEIVSQPADTCGDIITLKNGDEITAKVLEVSQTSIKYKKCNNLDGPLMIESIDNVFMIKYVNGSKDVFNKTAKPKVDSSKKKINTNDERKYNTYAILSFILSFFFFLYFIPSILALIFAIKALRQIKNEPDKYKGKAFALVGLIFSICMLSLLLLALLLIIISLLFFI
jgi:hypothetical protein